MKHTKITPKSKPKPGIERVQALAGISLSALLS